MADNLPFTLPENEREVSNELINPRVLLEMKKLNVDYDICYKASAFSVFKKRVFDLVLTIIGLGIFLPLLIFVSIWIKLDSPGPVLFKQIRVGKNGQRFYIFKFRTMVKGQSDPNKLFTAENDERITRCGKILRKYKLDELPQLFNVVKGDMSLVGPRPMIPKHVAQYPLLVRNTILLVLPGITDFASIKYINESEVLNSVQDPERFYKEQILPGKLSYNIYYIKYCNLWLDFRIIILTFLTLFHLANGRMPKVTCHKELKLKFNFKKN